MAVAYALHVDIIEQSGDICKTITFWGVTEEEVRALMADEQNENHAFDVAVREDRVIEDLAEIDESDLPEEEIEAS